MPTSKKLILYRSGEGWFIPLMRHGCERKAAWRNEIAEQVYDETDCDFYGILNGWFDFQRRKERDEGVFLSRVSFRIHFRRRDKKIDRNNLTLTTKRLAARANAIRIRDNELRDITLSAISLLNCKCVATPRACYHCILSSDFRSEHVTGNIMTIRALASHLRLHDLPKIKTNSLVIAVLYSAHCQQTNGVLTMLQPRYLRTRKATPLYTLSSENLTFVTEILTV